MYEEVFRSFPKLKKEQAGGRVTYTTNMTKEMTTRYELNEILLKKKGTKTGPQWRKQYERHARLEESKMAH